MWKIYVVPVANLNFILVLQIREGIVFREIANSDQLWSHCQETTV
jgi:hypothetical protein